MSSEALTRNQAMQVAGGLVYAAMEQAERGVDEPIYLNRIVSMALRTSTEVSKEM